MAAVDWFLIWSSARPMVKIFFNMGTFQKKNDCFGFVLAKTGKLTPAGSKNIAQVLVSVLYPCVFLSKIIPAIDNSTWNLLGLMFIWEIMLFIFGYLLGIAIKGLCNPPKNFRHGAVMATMMGNYGDVTLATVQALAIYAPFKAGDVVFGQALVSAYQVIVNLIFFSFCYMEIGKDFIEQDDVETTSTSPASRDGHQPEYDAIAHRSPTPATGTYFHRRKRSLSLTRDPRPSMAMSVHSQSEASGRLGFAKTSNFEDSRILEAKEHYEDEEYNDCNVYKKDNVERDAESADLSLSRKGAGASELTKRASFKAAPDHQESRLGIGASEALLETLLAPLRAIRNATQKPWQAFASWCQDKPMFQHLIRLLRTFSHISAGLKNPTSVSVVTALVISQIPAIKALLVPSDPFATPSVDQEPPLRVLQDTFNFVGAAAVPIGLINMGAAIGCLKVTSLPPARLLLSIAAARLLILPVVGILLCQLITWHFGWIDPDNKIYRFILMFQSCVPTAGSAVFLTQICSPDGSANEIAAVVLVQYSLSFISLTICNAVILTLLQ
ncbi:hypothetical protein SeMB42_g07423 [Synchytrium endobioticum]|uniref:Auxin efflux carrier n=1 Tax=Synchytrium endobioticum TaxID=286115 RepID=A0A507C6X5_9FUNG|nr:hypothetical protein SeMB42_g07423 [Synchytrium endobioticum]TPX45657.1 hypothetical protein SeLEV6574_g03749 [Synchytrium endobioticum]